MTQRLVYSLVVLAVSAAAAFGLRLPLGAEIGLLATAVLVLGIPHGSLDVLHAQDAQRLTRLRDWARFLALYMATAAAVVGFWLLFPSVSLVGLLVISTLHFSGDLDQGTPRALRIVHGLSPICMPALLHPTELGDLFGALAPAEFARALANALEFVSLPLLVCSLVLACMYARRHRNAVLEVAATATVCSVASPLLGFIVYFCLMHSWRHVDRTRRIYAPKLSAMVWSAALPTVFTGVAAAAAWTMLDRSSLESGVLQVVFIGLAALTVPHMLLIERVRLRGWRPRGVPTGA